MAPTSKFGRHIYVQIKIEVWVCVFLSFYLKIYIYTKEKIGQKIC